MGRDGFWWRVGMLSQIDDGRGGGRAFGLLAWKWTWLIIGVGPLSIRLGSERRCRAGRARC